MKRPESCPALCTLVLTLLSLCVIRPALAQDDDALWSEDIAWIEDEQGRRFRVHFDPATRVHLGVDTVFAGGDNIPWSVDVAFTAGFQHRMFLDSVDDQGVELVSWQMDHEAIIGSIRPWSRGLFGVPIMDATVFRANYLRHTREPFIVIPSSPPRRFFFPFDVGVEAELGRLRVTEATTIAPSILHIGAIRGFLLLDAWRSGEQGRTFEIGVGVRYDIDVLNTTDLLHRVAPFTAASLRFRYQSDDGRTFIDLKTAVSPHYEVTRDDWMFEAEVSARLERLLISINDEPISLRFDAGYERLAPSASPSGQNNFRTTLGLIFGVQLR